MSPTTLKPAAAPITRYHANGVLQDTGPVAAAKAAGLRYVSDGMPGIRRERRGSGFVFIAADGRRIDDADAIRRIRSLVIPPAWRDVWICAFPQGHIQATARDAKGRKQYRYHRRWREIRDETKYDRLIAFGKALSVLRKRTERDLTRPGLPREKILATVVRLLESTLIRVGNEEYARHNESFGLTTMRDHHVDVAGSTLRFEFRGKSGILHAVDLTDRRLARIVKRSQELPGEELFQYVDAQGKRHAIGSADVNAYLREMTGQDFTAKDFRTWAGTVLAAQALQEFQKFDSTAQAKRHIVRAIEAVARRLGNTKAVCRKCYIHPAIIDTYLDGSLTEMLRKRMRKEMTESLSRLRPEEAAVLALLQERYAREARRHRGRSHADSVQKALGSLLKTSLARARRGKARRRINLALRAAS
jgi:DNA topoisomerase I